MLVLKSSDMSLALFYSGMRFLRGMVLVAIDLVKSDVKPCFYTVLIFPKHILHGKNVVVSSNALLKCMQKRSLSLS